MKTIVVPTDFSVAAESAQTYAAGLAQQLSARLLLVHAYQLPVSMNDMPVLMISAEELKEQADGGLSRSREQVLQQFPGLEVQTESRLGDISYELNDLFRQAEAFLVVLGQTTVRGVEKMLFGSTALSVIRKSKVPVMVVPQGVRPGPIRQAALATDLSERGNFPFARISGLIDALQAQLHLIHVCTSKQEQVSADTFRQGFGPLQPDVHLIYDDNFLHGIQEYIHSHAIDLLITVPHHHTFWERLFFRTHTVELVEEVTLPVLCVNEE